MPKMKSHRGAAKRFRLTATGKVMRRKATGNHMLIKKTGSRKRRISGMAEVRGEVARTVKRLLGE
jgi:large subunit ribosomal protein L35